MRLRIDQGTVSLGGKTVLDHCNFEIKGKEKIGIVGKNGAGKTTLLHLISGKIHPDVDDKQFKPGIWKARNTTIGILEQNPFFEKDRTVDQIISEACKDYELFSKEQYHFQIEYQKMFTRFGFSMEDKKKNIGNFSGGEQTKIALIRLLLIKPDILLLDEPTNHLDISMVEWLEQYLKHYEKAVVIVSHDRFFMNNIVDVVYEIEEGKTKRYVGNYSSYRKQREQELFIQRKKYKEQQEEIKRLDALIERFKHKPKKASMARSKKKVLEKMEKIECPKEGTSYLYLGLIEPKTISSKWVYDCQKLNIGYDHSIREISLRIKRGEKIGIIGANGVGKTTFLKTLGGFLPPFSGKLFPGNHIDMEYFDQMTSEIHGEERLLEDFHKTYPYYSLEDCRKSLAKFLFRKEEIGKKIDDLSGGEKVRYVFAKIFEQKPNVLLLDEPTNHLDIPSKEILESAFSQYEGTLLFITHDRYFLKEVAKSLLIFEEDRVIYYPDTYERYLEEKEKEKIRSKSGIQTMEEENLLFQQSFENVPKKKRMQSARFNEEQSFADWQLTMAKESMEQKKEKYALFLDTFPTQDWTQFECYACEYGVDEEEYSELKKQREHLHEDYLDSELFWYEKWMDYEEAFLSYHDED